MENKSRKKDALRAEKQSFDWGTIRWLHDPESLQESNMMTAHVTFFPHKVQGKHLHTGDEQMLYILSGEGEQWIDQQCFKLKQGSFHHIPPYAEHDIVNTGDTVLEMMIVYNTNQEKIDSILPKIDFIHNQTAKRMIDLVDLKTLEKIIMDLSTTIGLSIALLDENNENLIEQVDIPYFCDLLSNKCNQCSFISDELINKNDLRKFSIEQCCYDLVKIHAPIYFSDYFIGTIICGPFIINEYSNETIKSLQLENDFNSNELVIEYFKLKNVSRSRIYAINDSLKRIHKFIIDSGINRLITEEFDHNNYEILKQKNAKVQLEKSLFETQMKVIQAQISPHFLFNTLSVIGELAYMKGAKEAAETTFALSGLLRTSLTKANEFVSVLDEINYIKDYVFIQNKRFNNSIELSIELSENVEKQLIPFMLMQILIENAILHGFGKLESIGKLRISGSMKNERIYLQVDDNGKGIEMSKINGSINSKFDDEDINKGTGLGLKSIKQRLKFYYDDDFEFIITDNKLGGTRVKLNLPAFTRED